MAERKPVIGISAPLRKSLHNYQVLQVYLDAVKAAGGIPLLLPACNSENETETVLSCVDAVLVPGGPDIDPFFYGEEPVPQLGVIENSNDVFEISLLKLARKAGKPILGICRGIQILNVAFGGTLYQDLISQYPGSFKHRQADTCAADATHTAELQEGSLVASVYGETTLRINSFHHQAVKDCAPGFIVGAKAKDGVTESIEKADENILGVQWHPEEMCKEHHEQLAPFTWLVKAAAHK